MKNKTKENKLFASIKNYKGNYACFLCALFLCVYPIVVFLVGFFSNLSFFEIDIILLLFFPMFILIYYFVNRISKINLSLPRNSKIFLDNIKNTTKRPEIIALAAFVIVAFIASVCGPQPKFALFVLKSEECVQEAFIFFIFYAICFYVGYKINDEKHQKYLIYTFVIMSLIVCILTYIDRFGVIFPAFSYPAYAYTSMFINSNHYAYFLTIAIMLTSTIFSLNKNVWVKVAAGIIDTLLIYQLLLNNTFGCAIAVFVGLIFTFVAICWSKKKFYYFALIPLVLFLVLAMIEGFGFHNQIMLLFKDISSIAENPVSVEAKAAGTSRWELWLEAFSRIKSNPIFGDGDVSFRPHNEYIQYAQVWGVFALVCYLSALVFFFIRVFQNIHNLSDNAIICTSAVGAYLISACFGNTMPHVMPFFVLIFGLASIMVPPIKWPKRKEKINKLIK